MKPIVRLFFIVSYFSCAAVLATTFANRPMGEVIHEAPLIVRGKAGERFSDKDTAGRIYTYTDFSVTEVLKGELKDSRILLRQPGGSKDGMEMNVPGTATFSDDEDAVVLLGQKNTDDRDSYDIPGFASGKYAIVGGENGQPMLINSLGGAEVYDPTKAPESLSYNSKIPLEVFKRLAKGEDIPEGAHKQFSQSEKKPDQVSAEQSEPNPSPASVVVDRQPQEQNENRVQPKSSLWVPISFIFLILIGVFILWRITRRSKKNAFFLLPLALLLNATQTQAYVYSTNSAGTPLRWASPARPTFYLNWNNVDSLSYSQIFTAFTNSLQRWKNTGAANIDFDYYQGPSHPATWANDSVNAIFFSSQASGGQRPSSSTIGVTYLYSIGGTIVETDLQFNDINFDFSTTPSDSSQFGSGNRVFLENVATHEIGHAYGLNHSAALQASMVFIEDRGQAKPSCDDIQGIAAAYPLNSFTSGRGSISGSVASGVTAVFGAHVLAISKSRGTVVQGAITQSDGSYTISDLEPGDYFLLIEPFQSTVPVTALCGGSSSGCSYGSVNSASVCTVSGSAAPFKRTFVESSAGLPSVFTVTAGQILSLPTSNVGCTSMTNTWGVALDAAGTAPVLLTRNAGVESSKAIRAVAKTSGTSQYFRLENVTGDISVKLIAYGLYSPFDAKVALLESDAVTPVTGAVSTDNVYTDASTNFINYDPTASLRFANGSYVIRVTHAGSLAANPRLYPAGLVGFGSANAQIDAVPFYLLIVTVNEATTFLPSTANPTMAVNARCESADTFAPFPDKGPGSAPLAGNRSAGSASAGSSANSATPGFGGGCGTIGRSGDHSARSLDKNALFSIWGVTFMLLLFRLGARLASRRFAR